MGVGNQILLMPFVGSWANLQQEISRGETMDDVIFSGSSSRSKVSHASIELLFDNSMGKSDSKFANSMKFLSEGG